VGRSAHAEFHHLDYSMQNNYNCRCSASRRTMKRGGFWNA